MHLTEDEFVDLVDGARPESSAPHLIACAACREQLADLRAVMASAADVDVPEPSPLFWDHFSRRVREAVAAERAPRLWWRSAWIRFGVPIAAALVMALWLAPGRRVDAPAPGVSAAPEMLADINDPSLTLVADLADGFDWQQAHDAGLAPRGSAEHAVTHLSEPELRELQRLLKVELAHASD